MGPWQRWFWRRDGQLLFWLLIALLSGWWLFGPPLTGPRWWWPFARTESAPGMGRAPQLSPAEGWTAVAKAAMPAVVNIAATRLARGWQDRPPGPFFADPFFRFFIPGPELEPRRQQSLGSGVLVSPEGYVLTNHHVVEGAEDIRVTLADRREFRARLVGSDPKTDLAVLKLPGGGFAALPLGDSDRVEVAETVLAIGNPFGLAQTVTMGIVSAVGRANLGIAEYEDFIQTDAAINPGNSGGALINGRGELIGINTAIVSDSGGYMGIGFAVPANLARAVMQQIIQHGRVRRGWLGVSVQALTPPLARALGLPEAHGILVAEALPDSPAARAGVRRGDVIVALDDRPADDVGRFRNQVAQTLPGSRVRLTVVRGGQRQTVEVVLGELPEPGARPAGLPALPERLGLMLVELTPDMAARLGLPATARGVLVQEVRVGGLGQRLGLRPGDVIQEVNGRPVRTPPEFARAIAEAADGDVVLLVNRRGQVAYVVLEPGGAG
jgi:serine protease Do